MLDLLVKNASLPDGRTDMSVAVQDGRITEVRAGLRAPAREAVDAQGYVALARPSATRTSTWTPR